MNFSEAEKQLDDVFLNKFHEEKFINFVKDLFVNFNYQKSVKNISPEFKEYVDSFTSLGGFTTDDKKIIKVFIVKLKKVTSRDRARTMQRNLIASELIKMNRETGALVAFYDDTEDWRLSFIRLGYILTRENGELKSKQNLTSPIRSSFLVGPNEPNHTCRKQLMTLYMDESKRPTLDEFEEIFDVEKVTDEFFKQYKELFLKLVDSLNEVLSNDKKIMEEFASKKIESSDFAKKLMGQIVFIYFLQKKGWLGISENETWGLGPTNFLRKLFEKEYMDYNNFFNDVLEPLFYEGFSEDRIDYHYKQFGFKVPFLNGGLFDPINNYDWINTDLVLENDIFSEILDTFDKFNFTIKEDEPLEKEVAVDPEMLGKVFENLLEIKDRKSKGAFYTPRQIVHYMCQQTIVSYLNTNTGIEIEDLQEFMQKGDYALESIFKTKREEEKYNQKFTNIDLPTSIKENSFEIEELLSKVKIIDPAVGSGAFPVGMMNEIVKARQILLLYNGMDVNVYDLKRETIEKSLYGVDIENSAVDITKLRFWLSLIVDEETIDNIKALPNLDNHIMCGDSLIDTFEGIEIFDKSFIKNRSSQTTLSMKQSEIEFKKLEKIKSQYFDEKSPNAKLKVKDEINDLKWNLITLSLKENGEYEKIDEIKKYKYSYSKPFFVYELEFSEVFGGNNPGFDIVIGNPPYVSNKGIDKKVINNYKEIYGIRDDLYNYFFLKGFDLLKENGVLSFITPDTYLTIESKINLRNLFQKNKVIEIIKMKNVFESAKVDNAILLVQKENMLNQDYSLCFKDVLGSFSNPKIYNININTFREYPFNVFFVPNKLNLSIYDKFKEDIKNLEDKWLDKIKTSKTIEKNKHELNKYRESLTPGDVTLLGLITDGGQGLATANNGKYVGVLEGTNRASKIIASRPKKLFEAVNSHNIEELKYINSLNDAKNYLSEQSEESIRNLFDKLKDKYGRDIFGQGFLFRIVSHDEIANVSELSDKDKEKGIKEGPTYVLYDKGDKEGNRYYLPSPYYIDWSEENVHFLKSNSGRKEKGMPVVRNPQFYFKSGFCWNNVLDTQSKFIKCRLKSESIHDVASMSLFPIVDNITAKYLVCMLNSTFIYHYQRTFVNNTVNLQMNDFRQHPIIVPTNEQLMLFESIFDEAYDIKLKYFDGLISKKIHDEELDKIQIWLDDEVNKLYGLV